MKLAHGLGLHVLWMRPESSVCNAGYLQPALRVVI